MLLELGGDLLLLLQIKHLLLEGLRGARILEEGRERLALGNSRLLLRKERRQTRIHIVEVVR